MAKLDLSLPLRTKAGAPVEIISANGRDPRPVIGYIGADLFSWTRDGFSLGTESPQPTDLENIPQEPIKTTRYVAWFGGNLFSVTVEKPPADMPGMLSFRHVGFRAGDKDA